MVRTLLITPFLVMPVAGALVWKTVMLDPTFGIINFIMGGTGLEKRKYLCGCAHD